MADNALDVTVYGSEKDASSVRTLCVLASFDLPSSTVVSPKSGSASSRTWLFSITWPGQIEPAKNVLVRALVKARDRGFHASWNIRSDGASLTA